jgi:hypothetical protein
VSSRDRSGPDYTSRNGSTRGTRLIYTHTFHRDTTRRSTLYHPRSLYHPGRLFKDTSHLTRSQFAEGTCRYTPEVHSSKRIDDPVVRQQSQRPVGNPRAAQSANRARSRTDSVHAEACDGRYLPVIRRISLGSMPTPV